MSDNASSSPEAVAFADRIGELLACMRSAEAELGALLVEIEQRGVIELFGYRSAARLLEHLADVPKPAAERLVKRARLLKSRSPPSVPASSPIWLPTVRNPTTPNPPPPPGSCSCAAEDPGPGS